MNFKALAASALVASTALFSAVPAEARPSRVVTTTTNDGTEISVAPVGTTGVQVVIDNKYTETGFIGNMNCATGRYQWRANDGYSKAQIEGILEAACDL